MGTPSTAQVHRSTERCRARQSSIPTPTANPTRARGSAARGPAPRFPASRANQPGETLDVCEAEDGDPVRRSNLLDRTGHGAAGCRCREVDGVVDVASAGRTHGRSPQDAGAFTDSSTSTAHAPLLLRITRSGRYNAGPPPGSCPTEIDPTSVSSPASTARSTLSPGISTQGACGVVPRLWGRSGWCARSCRG
jgi:hypothetical protein